MRTLALLLVAVAASAADDGFAKWFQRFQQSVAKGNVDQATEHSEFPMDWEYGSIRRIEARAQLSGRFDFYFTDGIKQAVADAKPERMASGDYVITWKARGNQYSMYFKPVVGGSFTLLALSEGPP